ncbi:MAG: amidohydrolase [Synergistes sp.]|nr:amidohydrolase [Synergistes sp.]
MNIYRDVVVWDAESEAARRCDVCTENGKISAVKPAGTYAYGAAYEGRGRTALIPGFINAHGHAAMTLLRGFGEDLPLMDWLRKRIWPAEAKLDGELVYKGTMLSILEMLSTGTTCFADMYFFMDSVAEAALAAGIKAGLSRGIVGGDDGAAKLAENLKLARDYNGARGLINVQLGPHAPYTVPFDLMKDIAAAAKENDLSVQLHWLETKGEWDMVETGKTMGPEEYLEKAGFLDVKHLLLAHCVWMDREKMSFYAKPNITVAHNPKSNLKLGSGVAPVAAMNEAHINVALGTDGASSNNRLDMWDEMRYAALLQKGVNMDPSLLSARYALRMATKNGAEALGFSDTGLIREGWAADFMLIDLDMPHYAGWDLENLPGYLVYAGSSADIMTTVVAGSPLYHMGEFPGLDAERIIAEAAEARKKLI